MVGVLSRWLLSAVNHVGCGLRGTARGRLAATTTVREGTMSKRARKRRDRKKGGANHGKRPNT
jgi:hypothetical protein